MEGDGLKKKKKYPRQKRPKVGPQNLLREDTIRLSDVFNFPILNDAFLKDIGISKATREKFVKTGGMDKSKRWDSTKDDIPKAQRTTMEEQSGFSAPPPRSASPRRSVPRPPSPSRTRAPSPQRRSPKRPEFKKLDPLDLQLDTIFKGLKVKRYATLRELDFNDRQAGVLLGMTKKGTVAPTTDAIERRLGKKILGQLRLLVDFPDEVVPQGSNKKHLFKDLNISVPKPHESAKMEEDARLRFEARQRERSTDKVLSPAKAVAPSAPVDLPSAPVQPPKPRTFKRPAPLPFVKKIEDVEDFPPPPRKIVKQPVKPRPIQLEGVDETPRRPARLTSSQLAEAKLKPTTTKPPTSFPSPPEATLLQSKKGKLKQVPLPLPSPLPQPRRTLAKQTAPSRPLHLEDVEDFPPPRKVVKQPVKPRPIQLEDVEDFPPPRRKRTPFVDPVLAQLRVKSVEPSRPVVRASSAPVRRPPAPLKKLPDDPLQLALAVEKVINKDLSPTQQFTDAQDLFAVLAEAKSAEEPEPRPPTPTKRPPAPKRRDLTPLEVRPEPPPSRRPSPKPARPKLRNASPNLGRPFQPAPALPAEDKTFRAPRSLSPELKPIQEGKRRGRPPNVPNTTQNRLAQQLAGLKGVEQLPTVKVEPPAPTPTKPTVMDYLVPNLGRAESIESVEETMSTNAPSPREFDGMSLKELNAEFAKLGWSTKGYGNSKLTRLQALKGTVPYKGDVEPPQRLKRAPTPVKTLSRDTVLAPAPVAPSPARRRPPKPPQRKPNVVLTSVGRVIDPLDEEEAFSVSDSESGASSSESGSDEETRQYLQQLSQKVKSRVSKDDTTDYSYLNLADLKKGQEYVRETKEREGAITPQLQRWREEQQRKRQEQEQAQDRVNELRFRQLTQSKEDVSAPRRTQAERDASRREREEKQARLLRESKAEREEVEVALRRRPKAIVVKAKPQERPLIETDPQAYWKQLRQYKINFDAEKDPFNKRAIEYDAIQFAKQGENAVLDKIIEGVEKDKQGSWDALFFYARRQDQRYREETTKELETGQVVDEKTGKSYRSIGAYAYAKLLGLAPSWLTKKPPIPKAILPSGDKVSLNPEDNGLADLELEETEALRQLSLDVVGQQKQLGARAKAKEKRKVIPSDKSPNRELLSSQERKLEEEIAERWLSGASPDTLESAQSPDFDLSPSLFTKSPHSASRYEREDVEGVGLFDVKWGTFKQLKERLGFKGSLHELAKDILAHPDKYSKKAFKKAQFYHNVIGGDLHIDINSHNNNSSDVEGEGIDNPDLYEKAKQIADKTYLKPSAYKSGFIVQKYKQLGGTYSGKKENKGIGRWFKEEWKDVGHKKYPVYRPTKRVSKDTPLTPDEIDPANLKKQIALKQKIKGKNLPAFKGGAISDDEDDYDIEAEEGQPPDIDTIFPSLEDDMEPDDVERFLIIRPNRTITRGEAERLQDILLTTRGNLRRPPNRREVKRIRELGLEGRYIDTPYTMAETEKPKRQRIQDSLGVVGDLPDEEPEEEPRETNVMNAVLTPDVVFRMFGFRVNRDITYGQAGRIRNLLDGEGDATTEEERRFMIEVGAVAPTDFYEDEGKEETRQQEEKDGNEGRGFPKFGGDGMMLGEDDISEEGNDTGSDDGEEIVETKSHHRIMAHPAMMSSSHFRHPNAQSNINALSGGLLRDDLQEGYNKVVPKSLRPAVSDLAKDSVRYVGRQMKPKAQKAYNKVVPKSLRPAVSELGKDAGNYVKRRLGFGLGAGMEGCGVKKYAKDALKTYVPASMRKSVKDLAKEGAKEFYQTSGAKSKVAEAKEHYGRAKEQYEEMVPKSIRKSVADLGKTTLKEGKKMSGMGSDPLHPTIIPHGTGMKKGSQEMKEKMAKLRAMRKKKMSGGELDAEPPRSRSYTTDPSLTGGDLPPRSRMP
jgi:hypothetical protein